MSGEEFEVRGEHEEAVESAAEHHHPLGQEIALFSAVLATFGAIVSFLGGHTQNEALYLKNEAVLMKARASDSWSYYQATSTKLHLAELGASLAPQRRTSFDPRSLNTTVRDGTWKIERAFMTGNRSRPTRNHSMPSHLITSSR